MQSISSKSENNSQALLLENQGIISQFQSHVFSSPYSYLSRYQSIKSSHQRLLKNNNLEHLKDCDFTEVSIKNLSVASDKKAVTIQPHFLKRREANFLGKYLRVEDQSSFQAQLDSGPHCSTSPLPLLYMLISISFTEEITNMTLISSN